jgi:hypothetical protein
MDLSILQKVSEMASEGRSAVEIKQELQAGGVAPEQADQALKESGVTIEASAKQGEQPAPAPMHHEKVIQPEAGFDPNAK